MLKRRVLVLSLAMLTILVTACDSPLERASYRVPLTKLVIAVERIPAHFFLAEYHRRVELNWDGRKTLSSELLLDTDGHGRINMYSRNGVVFLLKDAYSRYTVDIARYTIASGPPPTRLGSFVGSFDTDSSGAWRFIPASERAELPTEASGG
jgi:hypothetical protein